LSHVVERQRQQTSPAQSAISQKSRQSSNDANHSAGVPGPNFYQYYLSGSAFTIR
jgi:hypothetical protein